MDCKKFEESLTLYSYNELPEDERAAADAHLESCTECRARLDEVRRMHELLNKHSEVEPSPELLAECRMALDDAIDRELSSVSWKKLFQELWTGISIFPLTRASAILAVLLLGFGLGWTLRPHATTPASNNLVPGVNEGSAAADVSNMRINAITQVVPSPETGEVRITVDAERRMTLQGSLDDPHIRQVLVDAVRNYSNPGIRRDSLDALQSGGAHPSIRDALLYAIQNDPNLGVRLEALKAVRTMEWTPEVQRAVVGALAPNNNAGVRIAAIDTLAEHADDSALPVFEQLAASDSNRYVRLKSLTAIRRIEGTGD